MRDFVRHHVVWALRAGVADADGDEDLSRRLHAQTRLRLISMSDEELWQLTKLISSPPERPVELVYEKFKQAIEEWKATASEWVGDLVKMPVADKEWDNDR